VRLGVLCGLARTIYIRCVYGDFGREVTKFTVVYGVYIRFWPTLRILVTSMLVARVGKPYGGLANRMEFTML
jgi:hypothetical protein